MSPHLIHAAIGIEIAINFSTRTNIAFWYDGRGIPERISELEICHVEMIAHIATELLHAFTVQLAPSTRLLVHH